MVNFIGCVIIILFTGFSANAADACYDLFNPSATQILPMPSRFTVRSLLPKAFVEEIEAVHGPLNIRIEKFFGVKPPHEKSAAYIENKDFFKALEKTHTSLAILITAGNNLPVLKFQIAFKNDAPHIGEIFYLELSNPLSQADAASLHQTQERKGIPFSVLMETKDRLYSYLAGNGIRQLSVRAISDYTVSILYRRFLGFAPATPQSQQLFEMVDSTLAKAKKMPEQFRPKSIDEFSRSLHDISEDGLSFEEAQDQLRNFQMGHKIRHTTRIIRDEDGTILAVVLNAGLPTQKVRYLNENKFLIWRNIIANRKTELNLDLIP